MPPSTHAAWDRRIQRMFGSIAGRYDLMNTLMTFGRHRAWRREVVRRCVPGGPVDVLLDLGAGTGDIAREALRQGAAGRVVAADLTPAMMRVGRARSGSAGIHWSGADALELPFADATFGAVTAGYLLRNVPDVRRAFQEMLRVVRPGGYVVCLDTCPPPQTWLRPLILVHLGLVIPLSGGLITGQWGAYRYLPQSTRAFKTPAELLELMRQVGFEDLAGQRLMLGTMGLVSGRRPRV